MVVYLFNFLPYAPFSKLSKSIFSYGTAK